MNIIVITEMFPCKRHPISAVFFADLMKELALLVDRLTIITPRAYIPKFMTRFRRRWGQWFIDSMVTRERRMEIIRPYVPVLPGVCSEGINGVLLSYSLHRLLQRLMRVRKADFILGYNMLPEGVASVRLASRFSVPSGFWVIGSDINSLALHNTINRHLSKRSVKATDIVFTESRDLECKVRALNGIASRIETFYKGIDVASFQDLPPKDEVKHALGLDVDKRYLLFIGRLVREKGIYELLASFASIAGQYPDLDLLLLGEEIEKDLVHELLRGHGLEQRAHCKGITPHGDIPLYIKASELLILPTWTEGLPNVVMEAMAAGIPVIATHVGGIPEILEDEVTGLSIPEKSVEALTKAVHRMINDRELRESCVANARRLVTEKFDVKKNVHQLHRRLEELSGAYR